VNKADAVRQAALTGLFYYGESHYRPALTRPESLPARVKLVEPAAATAAFEQDRAPGSELIVRLAIAELVSAHGAFPTLSTLVQQLAPLVKAPAAELLKLPGRILGDAPKARAERFLKAYELAGGGGCQVRNFQLEAIYEDHISNVTASIEVERPVSAFVNGLDPRNWSETMPLVWQQSFEFDMATLVMDRASTPPQNTPPTNPPFADIPFFEKAVWSFGLGTLAYWRTVLKISLDRELAVPVPSLLFKYSLYECLENEFLGPKNAGGIDVDHGHGSAQALAGDTTWCKLEAQKVVRFTQPYLAINDLTFVALIIWFSALILTSACAPTT
jgi:hypothetical protein